MAQTLASEMAEKSLVALLDRAEAQREFSSDQARELLASCEIGSLLLEKLWHLGQGFLERGMEGRKLTFLLKELLGVIELGGRAFGVALDRVKIADLAPDEKAEGVKQLEDMKGRTADMRGELAGLVARLESLPPEIDPASLPGAREDLNGKGYVNLDELSSRLL